MIVGPMSTRHTRIVLGTLFTGYAPQSRIAGSLASGEILHFQELLDYIGSKYFVSYDPDDHMGVGGPATRRSYSRHVLDLKESRIPPWSWLKLAQL